MLDTRYLATDDTNNHTNNELGATMILLYRSGGYQIVASIYGSKALSNF